MSVDHSTPSVEYREIPECVGFRFGSDGSAWTSWRDKSNRIGPWRQLPVHVNEQGHRRISVRIDGKHKLSSLNHMITWAFHGPCPPGLSVQYRDRNPANNSPYNLYWGDGLEYMGVGKKVCTVCGKVKTFDEYQRRSVTRDGLTEKCLDCINVYVKEASTRPQVRLRLKDQWKRGRIKYRYGITIDDYNRLLMTQGGLCAICRKPPKGGRHTKFLCVDHDHDTGTIRGLLCHRCNTALGTFGDSLEGIMKVVDYLKRPRD